MKRSHEEQCSLELRMASGSALMHYDLVAIGPDIVALGRVESADNSSWSLTLRHFVIGNSQELISYIDTFMNRRPEDRYVLINEIGNGRSLMAAPSFIRTDAGYVVRCQVQTSFPRINAARLGTDLALSKDGDLVLSNNGLAVVSGVDALEQKVRLNLSLQKGELPAHPDFGARLLEYYSDFVGSPWLERLLKLDVIRLAAIPYVDTSLGKQYTALQCVDSVRNVSVLSGTESSSEVQIRVELDVHGVGTWESTIAIGTAQT
jgi:hypothetical protein